MIKFTCAGVLRGALTGALCGAYPLLSFIGARLPQPNPLGAAVAFAPPLLMLIWLAWQSPRRALPLGLAGIGLALLWTWRSLLLRHYDLAYLLQHAGSMLLLAWLFGRSLIGGGTPLVTRFAQLAHGDAVSHRILRYTRGVTWAWTAFFGLMALGSLFLFVATPLSAWVVFANAWTPALVIAMFLAEYLVRLRMIPAAERAGPIEAIRAYALYSASLARNAGKAQTGTPVSYPLPDVAAKQH